MNYTRSQLYTILLLYITNIMTLSSACHERWFKQKNAGAAASFALPPRVLQTAVFLIAGNILL